MHQRLIAFALLAASTATCGIVDDVRDAIARKDFARAEAQLQAYRKQYGTTPEMLAALSWLGRGALEAKDYTRAESYARRTYELCLEQVKRRPLDQDRYLPAALGASIEVQANAMASRGERSAAVGFLGSELNTWRATSIRARIQKNLNLLTLEGKPAPAIVTSVFAGPRPPSLAELKGRPVLLFFWAHWCGDCKAEIPVLARIRQEYGNRVAIVGPTQRYGYAARGEEAAPDAELKYIDEVRLKYYASRIPGFTAPVNEETFKNYGASTTPTIVLVDAAGIVRLYHPGNLSYEELKPRLDRLLVVGRGRLAVPRGPIENRPAGKHYLISLL